MPELTNTTHAYFEVLFSNRPRQMVPVDELPFFIGRGADTGNHLAIDDMRISRKCVAIWAAPGGLRIEDRGQLNGIFVNGEQTPGKTLFDGDCIRLGIDEGCQLIFRAHAEPPPSGEDPVTKLRSLIGSMDSADSGGELNRLRLLLEATSLLHSQLPLESVLAAMLDHAILITHADRGMLLEPDAESVMQVRVARGRHGESLALENMNPSRSVLKQAIEQESAVINEDLRLADTSVQSANSVVMQLLRSAVVIPLYCLRQGAPGGGSSPHQMLGAVYLDSKRTATFSALDRRILDALGAQAASILDNARLVEKERERQRLEQELSIAREIQQALVPQGLQDYPHMEVTGIHRPCHEVGGDYFDVFPLPDGRTALLIADVAGKGLGAALLTTILQGALSAMTLGVDPVKVFHHLNRFLCDHSVVGRYATLFFGLLDPSGKLEYVRASHPAPLLLRGGEVSELYTGGSFPVGLIEQATFHADCVQLMPGDTMVLYTDGVTEAQDKEQNFFGVAHLKEAVMQHPDVSLGVLQSAILGAVERYAGGAPQFDDITLLLFRYRRPGDRAEQSDPNATQGQRVV
jgi:serine phosphatase RsbU (regulator of sigma subunit)